MNRRVFSAQVHHEYDSQGRFYWIFVTSAIMVTGIVFCQSDPVRSHEALIELNAARDRAAERRRSEFNSGEGQEFRQPFNEVVDALDQFSSAYSRGDGNIWPSREAIELDKASNACKGHQIADGSRSAKTLRSIIETGV